MFVALVDFMLPFSMLLLFSFILVTVFAVKARRDSAREAEMAALAKVMGLPFLAKDSYGLERQLKNFELFSRGRRSFMRRTRVTNIIRGNVDQTEVYMFDYSYVVSTGKSSKRITQTVFFANDKNWYLPNFRLRPERWWHKVLSGLGIRKDINFEENEDFSSKFWLKSEFEGIVRKKFTPTLQQFLLEKPHVHLEGENYYLIAYKPREKLKPTEARQYFEACCELTRLMKTEGKLELLQLAEVEKEEPIALRELLKRERE